MQRVDHVAIPELAVLPQERENGLDDVRRGSDDRVVALLAMLGQVRDRGKELVELGRAECGDGACRLVAAELDVGRDGLFTVGRGRLRGGLWARGALGRAAREDCRGHSDLLPPQVGGATSLQGFPSTMVA